MKSKFILAASIAMAFAASAQAKNFVITGATSFQGVIHKAINQAYPSVKVAWAGTAAVDKAKNAIYDIGNGDYILTIFSGSVEGIKSLDINENLTVINPASVSEAEFGTFIAPKNLAEGTYTTISATADCALSDVFQASTAYQSKSLGDQVVGVMPFVWITNSVGKNLGIDNLTAQAAIKLLIDGGATASYFTGNAAHTNPVFATGRDGGSGTRMTALAEIKYPVGYSVYQWKPTYVGTGDATVMTDLAPWPGDANTVEGDGGFDSGSKVAAAVNAVPQGAFADNVLISYIAFGDTQGTDVFDNGSILKYNGVTYDSATGPAKIKAGAYTFWGYEHLFTPESGVGDKQSILDSILAKINASTISTKGIEYNETFQVQRMIDGDFVFDGHYGE